MGPNYVDLHIHTKHSDGTCTVREVVEIAHKKGLKAIAITDHDCIAGYQTASEIGAELGMEVIPGVELSSEIQGLDIHILGYFMDSNNPLFNQKLSEMKLARYERAKKIVENLNRQGIDLRFETVLAIAGTAAIGRPHIAAALLREELTYSFREAFDRYIGYGSAAYVEKMTFTPREVFDLIRQAGGVPVLAHPGITNVDDRIPEFVNDGLMGIEVFHSEHTAAQNDLYKEYCRRFNLAFTGGSDFHSNTHNKSEIGAPRVPYTAIKSLQEKLSTLSSTVRE